MNALRAAVSTVTKSPLKRILASEHRLFSSENKDNDMIDPPDDPIFTIPVPKSRENESFDQRKARLLYQSRKRGMLENDLLLSTFVAKYLNTFTPKQVDLYDKLINGPSNDWDIFYWASEVKQIPDEYNNEIMEMLKLHCKNINKESRIRQPDL